MTEIMEFTKYFDLSGASLNFLDMGVIAVFAFFTLWGYVRGLVRSVFDILSFSLSIYISGKLYPAISAFMRLPHGPYHTLRLSIMESMGLEEFIISHASSEGAQIISSLPVPGFITERLLEMNRPEVYESLGVSTITEYIAGYMANIVIDVISSLAVFLLAMLIIKAIALSLNVITKLPVINAFNKLGGGAFGAAEGLLVIWVLMTAYTLFLLNPQNAATLESSLFAKYFYDNNILAGIFLKL